MLVTLPCEVLAETPSGATVCVEYCVATLPWSSIVSLTQVVREWRGRIVDKYANIELTEAVARQYFDWYTDFELTAAEAVAPFDDWHVQ